MYNFSDFQYLLFDWVFIDNLIDMDPPTASSQYLQQQPNPNYSPSYNYNYS